MRITNHFVGGLLVGLALSFQAGQAQSITGQTVALENTPNGKTVKAWYTAWQNGDWNLMTQILADGFTFTSPLDDHLKIDVFKKSCWLPNAGKIIIFIFHPNIASTFDNQRKLLSRSQEIKR